MLQRALLFTLLTVLSPLLIAKEKPVLQVYTYPSFISEWGPGAYIKTAFEMQCDCQVMFRTFGDAVTILNQLRLEGKKSTADVAIGLDNSLIAAADKYALFLPHERELTQLNLPWQSKTFIPYDYSYFAFIYNKNKITAIPTSLHDLIDDPRFQRIIYQDPRTSTPGLGFIIWMNAIFGDTVADAWRKLAPKTVTITKGWSEAYSLFLKGEADFVLSYITSPIVHIMNDSNHDYAAAYFTDGHYQQIEVAGIVATTTKLTLAQSFLDFLLTPAVQLEIATKNIMYPMINTALPSAFDTIEPVNNGFIVDSKLIEENKNKWLSIWRESVTYY